ncbi:hypothetical protein Mgra_00007043 [Meloidogyne graminicola]|uniref:Uncharacterized protein n=1 Tax=Meloidogyne graminicola TaxID=189291 RepID=A0A8S9ZJW1_9BILA|nr:hypothetical protein Mgra_00007043 [Meloidogyne graminicola]
MKKRDFSLGMDAITYCGLRDNRASSSNNNKRKHSQEIQKRKSDEIYKNQANIFINEENVVKTYLTKDLQVEVINYYIKEHPEFIKARDRYSKSRRGIGGRFYSRNMKVHLFPIGKRGRIPASRYQEEMILKK